MEGEESMNSRNPPQDDRLCWDLQELKDGEKLVPRRDRPTQAIVVHLATGQAQLNGQAFIGDRHFLHPAGHDFMERLFHRFTF